ncbi:MAG: HAD-IIB family hydrolase [Pseudomonadota bacterium]
MARAEAAGVEGLLFDIDDTLTTAGRLTAEAYRALERLQDAGLKLVPITGRPAGWCDHIARMWPVDGVVGENGAFYFRYDHRRRQMTERFAQDAAERAENRQRLDKLAEEILVAVPGCALASDQGYRACDLAIDYREDVAPLSPEAVGRIVALFRAAGATAKVSSIHVNGWIGDHDKLTMTRTLFQEVFGYDFEAAKGAFVFVGDSPNDAPMFEAFPLSVGVANVLDFADTIEALPAYVTEHRSGAGFAELAAVLLAARAAEQGR